MTKSLLKIFFALIAVCAVVCLCQAGAYACGGQFLSMDKAITYASYRYIDNISLVLVAIPIVFGLSFIAVKMPAKYLPIFILFLINIQLLLNYTFGKEFSRVPLYFGLSIVVLIISYGTVKIKGIFFPLYLLFLLPFFAIQALDIDDNLLMMTIFYSSIMIFKGIYLAIEWKKKKVTNIATAALITTLFCILYFFTSVGIVDFRMITAAP